MIETILQKARGWCENSDSENTSVNRSWLQEHVVGFENINLHTIPWVFSHIPKTAGTTLENYLLQPFELKDVLHVNAPDLNRLPQVIYLKNKFPKLIMGHHPLHGMLYQLLPDDALVHLTMLREPVSRVISYYNYIATREYHALHHKVKDMGFDAFLEQRDLVELSNGQSRRLAGVLHSKSDISDNDLYKLSRQIIDDCFSLVGVTEYFYEFCHVLEKKCGIIFNHLPPVNRSRVKVQLTDLSPEQIERIKVINKVDIQLYEYVKSKFTQIMK